MTMRRALLPVLALAIALPAAAAARAGELTVTGIKAACRNGQTFVTWKDAAEGEAGAKYRYSLYRSDRPITRENLAGAELCYPGVLNNSAKVYCYAFWQKGRLDPSKPTYVLEEGGAPLPMWSGLAVRTVPKDGKSYYAVMVTDEKYAPIGKIVPGQSATTEPVEEKVAPVQPVKQGDSKTRGPSARSCSITGTPKLPLMLNLHGSQSRGGDAGAHGDLWVLFGTPDMGWRDGLPGIFSVIETHQGKDSHLRLFLRDSVENPRGDGLIETCWFGYYCVPVGAEHKEPRAYDFTEQRLIRTVDWVVRKYQADPLRVYSTGQSMGGMGSTQFSWRHPEIFAAVYPKLTRVRQTWLPAVGLDLKPSLHQKNWKGPTAMLRDGKREYFKDKMDSVKYAAEHHEDLPFYGFAQGKQDYVNPWSYMVEMVEALTASRHGFALSWNNQGHSSGAARRMQDIHKYYGPEKFARDRSFPAFGNSSIDSDMGNGEQNDGDPEGGINLGFIWSDVVDEEGRWSVKLSNDLAKAEMTVDVTPRWCQKFKPEAGQKFRWTNSAGGSGDVTADQWKLVTVEKVRIKPGEATTLTISR
jgi:hypothetical protein